MSSKPGFEWRNAPRQIAKAVRFETGYETLPSTYGNFVHRSVVEAASAGGRYYHSMTPDCYSAFANAAVMERYIVTNRSITIPGISGRSNGGLQFVPNQSPEAANWKVESDMPFHERIAYCSRSLELIVAEAFLQAQKAVPALEPYALDIARLARVALRNAPDHSFEQIRDSVADTLRRNGLPDRVPARKNMTMRLDELTAKTGTRLKRLAQGYRRIDCSRYGVTDIAGACRLARDLR